MCRIGNRKAEIQVHTLLEHAWAAVSHDRLYKTSFRPPADLERQLVRVAALLEESDERFSQTLSAINQYQADYGKYMSPEEIEEEIAKWQAVIEYTGQDRELAVKIAHYASALPDPDWSLVLNVLGDHERSEDHRVLRLLGLAKGNLHGSGRCHEISSLEGPALALAWSMSYRRSEVHYKAPESLYDMGFFTLLLGRPYDSLGAYARAVFVSPDEKPIFAELTTLRRLQQKISGLTPEPKWAGCLKWTIWFLELAKVAKLQQHVREMPSLIQRREVELKARQSELAERKDALKKAEQKRDDVTKTRERLGDATATTRKSDHVTSAGETGLWNGGRFEFTLLMHEIEAQADKEVTGAKAAVEQASLAVQRATEALTDSRANQQTIRQQAENALTNLKGLGLHNVSHNGKELPIRPGTGSIVIVIGSCDPAYESILQNYRPLLIEAFDRFQGLICSGGTKAGIGAMVGDIQQTFPKSVTTLGYLPRIADGIEAGKIEPWVGPDDRYHNLVAAGTDEFGPDQPLQYWTDLLAAGVEPYNVRVLGINGGTIAALEYRMALAFNAPVAVLEKSGREAARLLQNDDWGVAERLIVLPAEKEMIRAYIRAGSIELPQELSPLPDSIAHDIHEDYCELCREQSRREDPSLSDWDELSENLRKSSFEQAKHLADHLSLAGYTLSKGVDPGQADVLQADDIERIAEIEHARYVIERFLEGWKWGEKKEVEKKINPTLVAWSKLPDKEKEKDRVAARSIPRHFAKGDVRIVRKEGRTPLMSSADRAFARTGADHTVGGCAGRAQGDDARS